MKAYRTYLTVTHPQQIVIPDVPFQTGQVVEVLLLVRETAESSHIQRLDALFKTTQALPHVRSLTDEDIAAEIAAYRNSR